MNRRRLLGLGAAALPAVWLAGCGQSGAPEAATTVERIVSAGGDVTEILYRLGLGDQVVAVDDTSLFPEAALALPKVGYVRALGAEGVLSLNPTVLVATGDAGPATTLEQLDNAGLRIVRTEVSRRPEDMLAKVALLGDAFGRESEAATLSSELRAAIDAALSEVAAMPTRPRALFLLSAENGSPNAAGTNTAADAMIRLAGADNAVGDFEGYKALSPEAAVAGQPDVILVMSHVMGMLGGPEGVAANPALAATPAGRARRIVPVDGNLHLGFGPRLPEAIADLSRKMRA